MCPRNANDALCSVTASCSAERSVQPSPLTCAECSYGDAGTPKDTLQTNYFCNLRTITDDALPSGLVRRRVETCSIIAQKSASVFFET